MTHLALFGVLFYFIRKGRMQMYKWKISKYRKDKRTGPISPVEASEYYKYLLEGVGFDERKRDRKSNLSISLEKKRDGQD